MHIVTKDHQHFYFLTKLLSDNHIPFESRDTEVRKTGEANGRIMEIILAEKDSTSFICVISRLIGYTKCQEGKNK